MSTKIEWAQETWNPITGCTKKSEGCDNCYAQRMAKRLAGRYGYPAAPNQFTPTFHPERLTQLCKWIKPRMVFVCSMSDLFHADIEVGGYAMTVIFNAALEAPQHTYLFLTKRPRTMRAAFDYHFDGNALPNNWWVGVTAENQQRADERVSILLQIPAAVRFVSVEPMLGNMDIDHYLGRMRLWERNQIAYAELSHRYPGCKIPKLDWVICGGETGPGARPMQGDWARSLRDQCEAAKVPFLFKKHGDWWCKQFNTNPKYRENHELDGAVYEQFPVAPFAKR